MAGFYNNVGCASMLSVGPSAGHQVECPEKYRTRAWTQNTNLGYPEEAYIPILERTCYFFVILPSQKGIEWKYGIAESFVVIISSKLALGCCIVVKSKPRLPARGQHLCLFAWIFPNDATPVFSSPHNVEELPAEGRSTITLPLQFILNCHFPALLSRSRGSGNFCQNGWSGT